MALILRYFTEFVYNVVLKQLLGLTRFQNLLLIVYDHINTICVIHIVSYPSGKGPAYSGPIC